MLIVQWMVGGNRAVNRINLLHSENLGDVHVDGINMNFQLEHDINLVRVLKLKKETKERKNMWNVRQKSDRAKRGDFHGKLKHRKIRSRAFSSFILQS